MSTKALEGLFCIVINNTRLVDKNMEWFLVPLSAIDEVVAHLRDGTIPDLLYDPRLINH